MKKIHKMKNQSLNNWELNYVRQQFLSLGGSLSLKTLNPAFLHSGLLTMTMELFGLMKHSSFKSEK